MNPSSDRFRPRDKPALHGYGTIKPRATDGKPMACGWVLGQCLSHCDCHKNPANVIAPIAVFQDVPRGRLGLVSFTPDGTCGCCQPWTVQELAQLLVDVQDLAKLDTLPEQAGP